MGLFDKIKKSLFGEEDEDKTTKKQAEAENSESGTKEEQKQDETADTAETEKDDTAKTDVEADNTAGSLNEEDEEVEDSQQDSVSEEAPEEEEAESQTELYEKGLEKTNKGFGARLNEFFAQFRTVDEDFFDDLEELLIESDVGYETAEQLTTALRDEAKLQKAKSHEELKKVIVEKLVELYDQNGDSAQEKLHFHQDGKPNIYLFVGVNGAGKTTTIGKLAKRFKDEGKSILSMPSIPIRSIWKNSHIFVQITDLSIDIVK